MSVMRFAVTGASGLLLVIAFLTGIPQAYALDSCLYSSCERLLGTGLRRPEPYRSPNDLYNERNQDRYKSGIQAKPFDLGSPVDTTRSLSGKKTTGTFNDDQPQARSEHVRWCLKRYKSYAVESNTYVTYDGRTRFCDSPFR